MARRLCNSCYHMYRTSGDKELDTILGCPLCNRDPRREDQELDSCAVNSANSLRSIASYAEVKVDRVLDCVDIKVGSLVFTFTDEGGCIQVETKKFERRLVYSEVLSYLRGLLG